MSLFLGYVICKLGMTLIKLPLTPPTRVIYMITCHTSKHSGKSRFLSRGLLVLVLLGPIFSRLALCNNHKSYFWASGLASSKSYLHIRYSLARLVGSAHWPKNLLKWREGKGWYFLFLCQTLLSFPQFAI